MIFDRPQAEIVRREDHEVNLTFIVGDQCEYFNGHFENFRLLPGVVQLDWALRFGQDHFKISPKVKSIDILKFTRPIRPNTRLELQLKYNLAESTGRATSPRCDRP